MGLQLSESFRKATKRARECLQKTDDIVQSKDSCDRELEQAVETAFLIYRAQSLSQNMQTYKAAVDKIFKNFIAHVLLQQEWTQRYRAFFKSEDAELKAAELITDMYPKLKVCLLFHYSLLFVNELNHTFSLENVSLC